MVWFVENSCDRYFVYGAGCMLAVCSCAVERCLVLRCYVLDYLDTCIQEYLIFLQALCYDSTVCLLFAVYEVIADTEYLYFKLARYAKQTIRPRSAGVGALVKNPLFSQWRVRSLCICAPTHGVNPLPPPPSRSLCSVLPPPKSIYNTSMVEQHSSTCLFPDYFRCRQIGSLSEGCYAVRCTECADDSLFIKYSLCCLLMTYGVRTRASRPSSVQHSTEAYQRETAQHNIFN